MKHIPLTLAFTALTAGLAAHSATAALESTEAEAIQLETTVVTGGLWESELQNTTASVTVIDEAQLQANGVQHFEDIINAIPNLTWTGGSSRPRYIQIRGIGENSQFEGETPDSSVRFMVDDFDFTGIGGIGTLFDVQQVEVLRGPQAGAFGANAAGGVIRIVTNEPTPYWTGQAETTVGTDSLFSEGIAVGGPILENDPEQLTFRIAVHQLNQNGFRDNKFTNDDDTNKRDEFTSRLQVRWIANEDWQFDAALFYADFDNGFDEFTLSNSRTKTYSNQPGEDKQETFGSSLRSLWTGLDSVEVVSITSFVSSDSTYGYDGDWGAGDLAPPPFTSGYTSYLDVKRTRDVFNQEIRFNSVETQDALGWIDRWTTGIYYQHFDEDTKTVGTGDYPDYFKTTYTTDTFTFYGQATHDFSETTRLTLGLRAEYFDLTTGEDAPAGANFDDWLYGGKLTLEHDLSEMQTAFASVTRGYKAGGANLYPYLDPTIPNTYDSETLWNYEIGLRSEWFEGAVLSQVTLFYLDRDDAQLRGSDGDTVSFSYFTINGNTADHYGAEAETTWFINKNFTFNASLGLLQTNRDSFTAKGSSGLKYPSDDVANSPDYTYSASLNYVADNGIFANIAVSGSDEYYESESPDNRNEQTRHSFTIVDASVGYHYQNWTFTVWAKNLFGEEYEERVYYFNNGEGDNRYESPADPRSFGVTANYRW